MKKIITLALNPAVDRTMYFKDAQLGALNRASAKAVVSVGGKGITNAFVFKNLGIDVMCLGFWGGNNGRLILDEFKKENVSFNPDFTSCETRMNIKII